MLTQKIEDSIYNNLRPDDTNIFMNITYKEITNLIFDGVICPNERISKYGPTYAELGEYLAEHQDSYCYGSYYFYDGNYKIIIDGIYQFNGDKQDFIKFNFFADIIRCEGNIYFSRYLHI